jgi:hypothetical protein
MRKVQEINEGARGRNFGRRKMRKEGVHVRFLIRYRFHCSRERRTGAGGGVASELSLIPTE